MASLWGFGGVQIDGEVFTTSSGRLSFERVDVRNTTITGKVIVHGIGWRPIIDVELINTSAAQIEDFTELVRRMAVSQIYGLSFWVNPRYSSTDTGSMVSYACFLDSNITPEDIANVDVGQTISLRFIGENLITELPDNYSGQTTHAFQDEAGATYVDETATEYIMF